MKSREQGYILITTGLSLAVFIGFLALVTDLGWIFVTKSQLQNTTDAASLAAVVEIPEGTTYARQKALDFGQSHWVADSQIQIVPEDIRFGHYDFSLNQFQPSGTPTNAIEVWGRRVSEAPSGPLPLFFARLFGKETSNVQTYSRAVLDNHVVGVKGKNRLIPYSVIDFVVQDCCGNFAVGETINIHPRSDAPGNFGFLDLDGGSNGTPELRQYIEEGYDKDFVIPPGGSVAVLGTPGSEGNSLLTSFNEIVDEVVFLPVHDRVDYEGSNALFNVIAILAVRVKAVKLNGTLHSRYIRVDIVYFASSVLATDPSAPANNSLAKPRLVV